MVEEELGEEFDKLSDCLRKVVKTNDEYRTTLLAEAIKEERLGEALEGDIGKTLDEAETRFKQVSCIFQTNLWSRYGHDKITAAVLVAKKSAEEAGSLPVKRTQLEGYAVHLHLLEKRMMEIIKTHVSMGVVDGPGGRQET